MLQKLFASRIEGMAEQFTCYANSSESNAKFRINIRLAWWVCWHAIFLQLNKTLQSRPPSLSLYLLWVFYKVHMREYFRVKLKPIWLDFCEFCVDARYAMAGKTSERSFFATIETEEKFLYVLRWHGTLLLLLITKLHPTAFPHAHLFFPFRVHEGDFSCFSSSTIYNRFSSIFLRPFPFYLRFFLHHHHCCWHRYSVLCGTHKKRSSLLLFQIYPNNIFIRLFSASTSSPFEEFLKLFHKTQEWMLEKREHEWTQIKRRRTNTRSERKWKEVGKNEKRNYSMEHYVEKLMMIVVFVSVFFRDDISLKQRLKISWYVVAVISLPLLFLAVAVLSLQSMPLHTLMIAGKTRTRTLTQSIFSTSCIVNASSPPSAALAPAANSSSPRFNLLHVCTLLYSAKSMCVYI